MSAPEINPIAIARAFMDLVTAAFPSFGDTFPSDAEKQVAELLFSKFEDICTEYEFVEDNLNDLELDMESSADLALSEGTQVASQDFVMPRGFVPVKQKAKILKLINENPSWKFKTIKSKYSSFKDPSYKRTWQKHVNGGGNVREIYLEISQHTYKMFQRARSEFKAVHDSDIRRWAVQKASEFPFVRKTFVASHRWIQKFKRAHKISSRKVQKLVLRREVINEQEILKSAEDFRMCITGIQPLYDLQNIWNTDQIGFTYEYASARTLSYKNEKFTFGSSFSPKNRMTHSYTIQYIISAAGEIVGDVFLCLQEPSGRLGESVENNLFLAPNVCLTCIKSGKLTSTHVKFYVDKVIRPESNNKGKILYILDSWGGHKDEGLYSSLVDENLEFDLKVIPKHCTPFVQPLDVYFNLQLKYLVKRIYAHASLKNQNITARNNIIKLQSLAHFILKSPKFRDMIRFCFLKAGIIIGERVYFKNVKEICFEFKSAECYEDDCKETAFIRCSWCDELICYDHFFSDYHVFDCVAGPYLR